MKLSAAWQKYQRFKLVSEIAPFIRWIAENELVGEVASFIKSE